jgi:hypothetical protein
VAKSKNPEEAPILLEFSRTGNAWIDAGIVGLYRVIQDDPPYVPPRPAGCDLTIPDGVCVDLSPDKLAISGPISFVQRLLEQAYDRLVATYFNVSSQKQKDDTSGYNFYFDSTNGSFATFSKKKAAGAASLLFDKAARPSRDQVAWGPGPDGKKQPGKLPPSHAEHQGKLDTFLAANGLKPGPPAGLLIDGPNAVRPKVEIRVGAPKGRAACFLVGDAAAAGVEAKETAFPLLGGSRSFVNGTTSWPRLGWKADFVGKFVPALAFFYRQGDDIHLFLPQSNSLSRVNETADALMPIVDLEANLFRNFDFEKKLGGYFSGRSEVVIAFLHRVFVKLTDQRAIQALRDRDAQEARDDVESLFEDDPADEPLISSQDVYDATQRGAAIGFAVISAVKKGNVWMARDYWTFQDVVYLARLFERMGRLVKHRDGVNKPMCPPGSVLRALMDFEAKDEARSMTRDRVCEAVLHRRPVLHLLERHAFHVNTHSEPGKSKPVYPLLQFARLYEVGLREGTFMGQSYQKMVGTATKLGDQIGLAVANRVKDKESPESRGQARGALFRLRKSRSIADFMNELARLQFRYEIAVPDDLHDADVFNPETFEDFRGFCVVAALSRYLTATYVKSAKPSPST